MAVLLLPVIAGLTDERPPGREQGTVLKRSFRLVEAPVVRNADAYQRLRAQVPFGIENDRVLERQDLDFRVIFRRRYDLAGASSRAIARK